MVTVASLSDLALHPVTGYRLVNSKFPPIPLFDDVADAEELDAVYEIQRLTNPRLQNEIGNLNLLPRDQIPFGIDGLPYAVASFTHVNPNGSRFSTGDFGVMYIADNSETALAEVTHHQQTYWGKVEDLAYDRFVFRELCCDFVTEKYKCIEANDETKGLLAPNDYSQSQQLGRELRQSGIQGLRYPSVRLEGGLCFGLFSPKTVKRVVQAKHYEMVYREGALQVNQLLQPR